MTPEDLRTQLRSEMQADRACWLRLDGLSLAAADAHRGLCHVLASCGLENGERPKYPHTVVLDWQGTECCTAEGVAFFIVVVQALIDRGARLYICAPDRLDTAEIIDAVGGRSIDARVTWLDRERAGRRSARALVAFQQSGLSLRSTLGRFLAELSDGTKGILTNDRRQLVVSMVMEIAQNILSHSQAKRCAVSALLFTSKRPPVLQVGMADDGVGVAMTLTDNRAHAWALHAHDATVAESVMQGALSRRTETATGVNAAGGLGLLIERLRRECVGEVYLRSGLGLVHMAGGALLISPRKAYMNHGFGTQLRISVPVDIPRG